MNKIDYDELLAIVAAPILAKHMEDSTYRPPFNRALDHAQELIDRARDRVEDMKKSG